jgi:prepilin-type N-terminal cleavage/methylation domain-containing protein
MKFVKKSYLPPGFTLVEIMVSMVITLIVMGGVYRTLADEDINHDRSEKILDMQNNARSAMERIARDVRRTGSLGCGGELAKNTLKNSVTTDTAFISQYTAGAPWTGGEAILSTLVTAAGAGTSINFLSEVMGFNNDAAAGHALYQVATDALTLVYLSEEREVVGGTMGAGAPPTDDSFTLTARGFGQNDILYITDCQNYSLFQKTNGADVATVDHLASTGINTADVDLGKDYGAQATARVFKLNTATYFIRTGGGFELCRNDITRQIASNIEDLQFEFLGDLDGNGNLANDTWQPSLAGFTSARAVRAVRIWVLAMSEPDFSYSDNNTYDYPNSPYYTPDPNTIYRDAAGNLKPPNPFTSLNGAGGSPAALALASPPDGEHRHRYLASAVVYLRNAGLS